jgi:hypothetical protein
MTARTLLRFVAGTAAYAAVAHLVIGLVVLTSLRVLYPHRVFDVRQWSDDVVASFRLIGTYLKSNARGGDRPVLLFAGSSVTFGYPWHERFVFSRLVANQRPDYRMLNGSIIAADVSGINDWIVCAAKRNRIRFDAIVVEVPVVNTLAYLANLHRAGVAAPNLTTCEAEDRDPDYLQFVLLQSRGLGWIDFLWNSEGDAVDEQHMRLDPVPNGYFASAADFAAVADAFASQIVQTVNNARTIAGKVYVFPSPVFVKGLTQVGEDAENVGAQLRAALVACQSVRSVQCIDPSPVYADQAYFYNFTHLNQAGHRALAEVLAAGIEKASSNAF